MPKRQINYDLTLLEVMSSGARLKYLTILLVKLFTGAKTAIGWRACLPISITRCTWCTLKRIVIPQSIRAKLRSIILVGLQVAWNKASCKVLFEVDSNILLRAILGRVGLMWLQMLSSH